MEKVSPTEVNVLYIDYGNRAVVPKTKVFILSSSSVAVPASFLWGAVFAGNRIRIQVPYQRDKHTYAILCEYCWQKLTIGDKNCGS